LEQVSKRQFSARFPHYTSVTNSQLIGGEVALYNSKMETSLLLFGLAIGAAIVLWIYKRPNTKSDTLEAQGIAHEKALPIIGNLLSLFTMKEGIINFIERIYSKFNGEK